MTSQTQDAKQPRDVLYIASLVLVVIGVIISAYLSYTKLTNTSAVCLETGSLNCDIVQSSAYSKFAGIDIAYLGLVAYLSLGGILLLENRVPLLQTYGKTLIFGGTLFGFLYALWLIYVQAGILQAFCTWCLGHETTMTLLFMVSSLRLWQSLRA